MRRLRRLAIFMATVTLSAGCTSISEGTSLVPIPSEKELLPASAKFTPKVPGSTKPLADFKTELTLLIRDYHGYAVERRRLEWNATGLTTYGGLLAVAGALADRTGLLNTGAGIAGIGLVANSRYNFAKQSNIYIVAIQSFSCILGKIVAVPDALLADAMLSDDANAAEIASGTIPMLINMVDTVRISANNSILGIAPTVPSRDELAVMLMAYSAPAPLTDAPRSTVDSETLRRREAGEAIKKLIADVSVCTK